MDSMFSLWMRICEDAKGGEVIWVIDALDECNEIGNANGFFNAIVILLRNLNSISKNRLSFRVLFTSRPETWRQVSHSSNIDITAISRIVLEDEAAIEADINAYIHEEVAKLHIQEIDKSNLESQLCAKASRSFIWVKLTLKSIETDVDYREGTWDAAVDAIPVKLEETYEKLLEQLSGPDHHTGTANPLPPRIKRLLQFVVGAHGFLTVRDLSIFFAREDNVSTIEDAESKALSSSSFFETIYGSFLRLVRGLDGIQQVRLIHETARKHLLLPESESKYAMQLHSCHLELAKGCVTYLALDNVADHVSAESIQETDNHPLLKYAVLNWASHVRESEELMDDELFGKVLDMYRTNSQRFQNWSEAYWMLSSKGQMKSNYSTLHMCAYNGHMRVMKRLLEDKTSVFVLRV
ncbi:hypothetical protein ONS96_008395 [Cadophora gregata f. sp. sojae]|nr:hypothetical protein ONS96_008395 [Cadophora gregata f. sp. sojae]